MGVIRVRLVGVMDKLGKVWTAQGDGRVEINCMFSKMMP
jgi:hypothetical protein